MHELATNACKSGALSVREGWVPLRIEEAGDRIKLLWREHGGPPVVPPEAKGFGSRLLGRLGSQSELTFEPDGCAARCTCGKA